MATNGEINKVFGIYKSVCCGSEIVIPEGVAFPDCPNHLKLPTSWKALKDEKIRHVSELPINDKAKKTPAA